MDKPRVSVRYALGKTLNVGNYESVRFDVGVEIRGCRDQAAALYEEAREFVLSRMKDEVDECRKLTNRK